MLHVTNGDSAAAAIARAGVGGRVLAWRDVLHEGPVPSLLADDELRETRARFLAGRGWATLHVARAELAERDRALAAADGEVVLWFEHDLSDQLQLIQVLDRLDGAHASLVQTDHYVATVPPPELARLFEGRPRVEHEQLELARRAWSAFRSPDPTAIEDVLSGDTSSLPFLAPALTRHLEQFPSVQDGLSRTERQILECAEAGVPGPTELFRAVAASEQAEFLGDRQFDDHVDVLRRGGALARLELTELGRDLLAGRADWVELHGSDRWLGGVHVAGREPAWRWDRDARALRAA